jgi:hypothetical protein
MSSLQKFHRRTQSVVPSLTVAVTITNTGECISTVNTSPAITFAADLSTLPTGSAVKFINSASCNIIGQGGPGGSPGAALAGGAAISVLAPIQIDNLGTITGGGGGGARGGGSGGNSGGYTSYAGGVGGAAGAAVSGNTVVTWVTTGTRYGAVS